jgi:hypothetical protein
MTASGWSDDELAWLQRCYDTDHGGHDDVVALIRGVRAVLALCESGIAESRAFIEQHVHRHYGATEPGSVDPESVGYIAALERVIAALNLDPIGDTP